MTPVSIQGVFPSPLVCPPAPEVFDTVTVLTHQGGEDAGKVFRCVVCDTATVRYNWLNRVVGFVDLRGPI